MLSVVVKATADLRLAKLARLALNTTRGTVNVLLARPDYVALFAHRRSNVDDDSIPSQSLAAFLGRQNSVYNFHSRVYICTNIERVRHNKKFLGIENDALRRMQSRWLPLQNPTLVRRVLHSSWYAERS